MSEESYQIANVDAAIAPVDVRNHRSNGVFSIPPEIWSTIFEFSKTITDDDPLYEEGRAPPKMSAELIVSHTCLFFRTVALGTPCLWTSLQINGSCSLEWVSECIHRSGSCWLDIIIEVGEFFPQNVDDIETMMDLIIPHSLRWRSLSLSCSYESTYNSVVSRLGRSPATGLRYLSLHVDDVENPDQTAVNNHTCNPQIFADSTARLTFVRLRGLALHLFRPRLETLNTLHLDHIGHIPVLYSTFRAIVTRSPCLEHLSVHGDVIGRDTWPRRATIIQLPQLRSLRICGVGGEIYPGMLLGIDTPQLESLTLKDVQEEDLDPLWDLNDSTRYSKLTRLTFINFDFSEATYIRLCETFRNITSFLALHSTITESPLMSLLALGTVTGQDGPFTPWTHLRELGFNFNGANTEEDLIEKVIEFRKKCGQSLSRFVFRVDNDDFEQYSRTEEHNGIVCQFYSEIDVWPHGRTYIDCDDILFL